MSDAAAFTPTAAAKPAARARTELLDERKLAALSPADRIAFLRDAVSGRVVFTHGFGIEGQLIFHWICERDLDIDVVTIDTRPAVSRDLRVVG